MKESHDDTINSSPEDEDPTDSSHFIDLSDSSDYPDPQTDNLETRDLESKVDT